MRGAFFSPALPRPYRSSISPLSPDSDHAVTIPGTATPDATEMRPEVVVAVPPVLNVDAFLKSKTLDPVVNDAVASAVAVSSERASRSSDRDRVSPSSTEHSQPVQ